MAIEIVDLPVKNGDFPWLCKRLPEGTPLRTCESQHVMMRLADTLCGLESLLLGKTHVAFMILPINILNSLHFHHF